MERDVWRMIALSQAAYARCIDEGRFEEWPEFFLDDNCHYKITTARNYQQGLEAGVMWADSRGMLMDRVSALREANIYERHRYRHILGQALILSESSEELRSETSFLVLRITRDGPTDIFATGRYLDHYRIDGDKVKLIERVAVCDSSCIDTLLAIPL